ncbi:MAG: prepilin peptidase [Candidatus Vogelbacteria bacterium]|nr:prepilin peptidase [Candidatus Vogelbacteria bacterium]
MTIISSLIVFVFGLIIGSFLNVLIYRYNTGKGVNGRSMCLSCGSTLKWQDMFPLISFLKLLGRCRHCKAKISYQYFFVELATGIVFVLTCARLIQMGFLGLTDSEAILNFVIYLGAMSILVAIFVYDLRHKIIPDGLVYTFTILALLRIISSVYFMNIGPYPWFVDIVSGALPTLFFAGLWYFSGGKWMGLGDGKLVLGMSWLLPFSQNFAAIFIAFWAGAVIGILLMLGSRIFSKFSKNPIKMKTELPFAPFLISSLFVVFLFGITLNDIFSYFQFNF